MLRSLNRRPATAAGLAVLPALLAVGTAGANEPTLPSAGAALSPATTAPIQIEMVADRPDMHAPLGVLGDHPQYERGWTFSYRYVRSDLDGLVDGKEDVSLEDVFAAGSATAPTQLVSEEHLFSMLYGHSDRLSFLMTVPWLSRKMDIVDPGGVKERPRSMGLGDIELSALYTLRRERGKQFHFNLGLSLPTGSRDEKGETPTSGGEDVKLPYAMQLGSGTIDLRPGLTYFRLHESTSWGAQAIQTVRLGENSDDYALGDETFVTAWVARRFRDDLSGSVRLAWRHTGRIEGSDDALDPDDNPASDPHTYGGDRLDAYVGVNYTYPGGHRFAAEVGGPIFQDLNGPQLETDVVYVVGWEVSF